MSYTHIKLSKGLKSIYIATTTCISVGRRAELRTELRSRKAARFWNPKRSMTYIAKDNISAPIFNTNTYGCSSRYMNLHVLSSVYLYRLAHWTQNQGVVGSSPHILVCFHEC